MSQLGQTRKSGRLEGISGLPSKPDVAAVVMLVSLGPKPEV